MGATAVSEIEIHKGGSPFDALKRTDAEGEHWFARELMVLMGYSTWERFAAVVEKAMESLRIVQGNDVVNANFRKIAKVSGSRGPAAAEGSDR